MDRYFLRVKNIFERNHYMFIETFHYDFDRMLNAYYFSDCEILRIPLPKTNTVEVYADNGKKKKLVGMIRVDCKDFESLQNGGDVD